jgi:hypothetical protein
VSSLLLIAGITENSRVPLEWLEIKEAIVCKGTIESTGNEFDWHCTTRHTKRRFFGNIVNFNVPKSAANCYWSPHATKNPNAQIWGDWIYQDARFFSHDLEVEANHYDLISSGMWNTLNEDLKNPNWLGHEKYMKDYFSQKAFFVSRKKENKLPLQIFLKERKLARIAEGPLKKENSIVSSRDGRAVSQNTSFDELFTQFNNELEGTHYWPGSFDDWSHYLVILYNPVRNEAIPYNDALYANNDQLPEDAKSSRAEWRKDARIIVYRFSETGRYGLATLENLTK